MVQQNAGSNGFVLERTAAMVSTTAPSACRGHSTTDLILTTYTDPSRIFSIIFSVRINPSSIITQSHLKPSNQSISTTQLTTPCKGHKSIAKMNSQVWQPTRRVVVQAARSSPSISRGASSATSNQSFYQYASHGLRKLARQRQEVRAPADWMSLIRNAGRGLPM